VQIHRAARRFPLLNVTCSSPAGLDKGDFLLARAARPSCTIELHDRGNAALALFRQRIGNLELRFNCFDNAHYFVISFLPFDENEPQKIQFSNLDFVADNNV
jgi:hypothetical protein